MSIEIQDLCFGYTQRHPVLSHLSCKMEGGKVTTIIGSNGTGKTTLLRCMLALLPYQGNILINGKEIRQLERKRLSQLMAYVPQKCHVSYNYEAIEMVMMGSSARLGRYGIPGEKEKKEAMEAMEKVGISDLAHHLFWEISGGEQQLVLIARSLMQRARTLLMDEPVSSLDFANQVRVLRGIRNLATEGYCIILTSHNPDQAYRISDHIIAMKDGSILMQGCPKQIINASLVTQLYGIDAKVFSLADDTIRICIPEEEHT